ncbi:MAG: hypothetical protein QM805_11780 [Pseudomonas sp.]
MTVPTKAMMTSWSPMRGCTQPGLGDEQASDRRGEQAADREGGGDDAIGADSEHLGHAEILGCRAHFEAEPGRFQEPGRRHQEDDADKDRDELEKLQPDARDLDLTRQHRQRKSTPFGRDPTSMIITFSIRKLTAKEAISSVAGSAPRSGRKAMRSTRRARIMAPATAPSMASTTDCGEKEQHGVARDHDELRMCEVDEPHDPEDEADAERGKRIEPAHTDRVDKNLDRLPDHAAPAFAMATPK